MARRVSRKHLRALYLQPAPLFGGAERQAALITRLMPQFGVDVTPMVGPGHVVADWLHECGVQEIVETQHFPGGWKKQRGLARLTLPFRYFDCGLRARVEIAHWADAQAIDIVLASLPFAWITGGLVARERGVPIVWRAGGTYLNLVQKAALWTLTRFMQPSLLLCNSEAVRDTFAPLVPAPVAVVPNGVDPGRFHPGAGDARRYRPTGCRYVVGCAMRLADSKRPQDFVALAARLRHSHPDVSFLLSGEGSRRKDLEQLARELGADNLTFLGFVADMPSFYAACDVLVLPSRSEGCPNFLLEGTAMGKPLVAAAIPPIVELVRVTENAVLFELGDVPGLVKAVVDLLREPERLQALGQRGLQHIDQFTARASAAKIAAILQSLVDASSVTRPRSPEAPRRLPRPALGQEKTAAE
jgi:glycosyltransferase involved in cell wall biosynthesis